MRKLHLVAIVAFAMTVFCALIVSSAFAVTQWLEDGNVINAGEVLPVTGEGEFTITSTLFGIQTPVDCNVVYEEVVESGGKDMVIDMYDLLGKAAGTLDSTDVNKTPISCLVLGGGCTNGLLANVWVVKLNLELNATWKTQVTLEGVIVIDELATEAGYVIECEGALGTITTECTGAVTKSKLTNETSGVLSVQVGTEKLPCTVGEAKITGEELLRIAGKILSVSDV